jgi:hypothetical protein
MQKITLLHASTYDGSQPLPGERVSFLVLGFCFVFSSGWRGGGVIMFFFFGANGLPRRFLVEKPPTVYKVKSTSKAPKIA